MGNKNKMGLSPVVATVLLIAMVIIIGIIIFLWFRGFTQESITKFGERNVEIVCGDVNFQATYSGGILSVSNIGNVPIYNMVLKISEQGKERSVNLNDVSGLGWPDKGLTAGASFSGNINTISNNPLELTLIPVLIGTSSEGGEKTYVCNERQYGKTIL